jgi:membrane fusion protein (multidrug efflux system)
MKAAYWLVAILAGAALGAGIVYWRLERRPSAGEPTGESRPVTASLIAVSQPAVRTLSRQVPWVGVVQSRASVQLKALQAGRVEAIDATDQTPVRSGDVILRLGGPQIETQRARLQTDVQSLKTQLDLANQTIERLQQNLGQQLATADQVASAQEDQVKLQAELRNAQLALESFEGQARVVSPMAGVFTNRRVSPGQTVGAGDAMGDIVDSNNLRIAASLFPPEGVSLEGREATIRLEENDRLAGTVARVLPEASGAGATAVWIEGPQIDERLHPGQTVSGDVTLDIRQALTVPQSAVVYDANEQPYIFVQEDGTYTFRAVRLGLTQGGWVEVLSGLEQGRPVVTQGAYELFYRRFNEQFKVED